jgi:hypothetical protein
MEAAMLYESPYTDFHPQGVGGTVHSGDLVAVIDGIRNQSVVA